MHSGIFLPIFYSTSTLLCKLWAHSTQWMWSQYLYQVNLCAVCYVTWYFLLHSTFTELSWNSKLFDSYSGEKQSNSSQYLCPSHSSRRGDKPCWIITVIWDRGHWVIMIIRQKVSSVIYFLYLVNFASALSECLSSSSFSGGKTETQDLGSSTCDWRSIVTRNIIRTERNWIGLTGKCYMGRWSGFPVVGNLELEG